ncbi:MULTISPECIES: hypothetical protein [unclassified Rhizobium]|uniref:hypothetical protein n=1 Tax=unclassified Rhizobium TaxID=2613769 RepID=UPI000BD02C05|nr:MULTISPECIES: hypothetical protein [unclassified Rhizobium]MDH7810052.1 hypothetical protein [Rhizobium sp. AN67]MDQ4408663.1 hypothetical protein [Rhizobium sp. AN63]SOD50222.1 hypothetical protein SAMN05216595_0047 [Rhizobium sp. AN6A]
MPCSDPRQIRDRGEEWAEYFYNRRGREILQLITDELLEEHCSNWDEAKGFHSENLQKVLNFIRNLPAIGKDFAYEEKPYESYRLGRITKRGVPPELSNGPHYMGESEAVHAILLARIDRIRQRIEG